MFAYSFLLCVSLRTLREIFLGSRRVDNLLRAFASPREQKRCIDDALEGCAQDIIQRLVLRHMQSSHWRERNAAHFGNAQTRVL